MDPKWSSSSSSTTRPTSPRGLAAYQLLFAALPGRHTLNLNYLLTTKRWWCRIVELPRPRPAFFHPSQHLLYRQDLHRAGCSTFCTLCIGVVTVSRGLDTSRAWLILSYGLNDARPRASPYQPHLVITPAPPSRGHTSTPS